MKLYQTTASNGEVKSRWAGSQAEATKHRVAMKKEGLKNVETHEQEVPTNKTDLLAWLNEHKVVV